MKLKSIIYSAAAALALTAMASCGQKQSGGDSEMNAFIDELMGKMTLEEKLGQLNLPASDDIVTGQAQSSNIGTMVSKGQVGGVFNIKGVAKIKELQIGRASCRERV